MCRPHNHPWRGLLTRAVGSNRDGWRTAAGVLLLSLVFLGVLAEVAGAIEVPLPKKEHMVYGDFPMVGRRVAVWVIAQLHLMFGAFVVGVPLFILIIEILGAATKNQRYDDLAHEFTRLLSVAFSTTATFGGILVFFLIGLYPTLMNFLARIFFPSMVVYVFLFFGEGFSMYLYYYGWEALKGTSRRFGTVLGTAILTMLVAYPFVLLLSNILRGLFGAAGSAAFPLSYGLTVLLFLGCLVHGLRPGRTTFLHNQKWMHICFGILLNYFGLILMMISNSWATFMTSPAGVDLDAGVFRGTTWDAMNNFTWMPVNLHRFIANIAFGGSIVAAYAAFRFLASPRNSPERAHYDWMGYIGNFIAIIGLIPLPFAGYWLGREIYGYDQQLGITMMGGIFSWLFIVQAVLIGALFLGANYYLWLGMERIPGSERYRGFTPFLLGILTVCFLVWLTPHSLVASLEEARKMGGAHHPLLGVFGVMSAKNTVVNIMILTTFLSFLLYRRGNKGARAADGAAEHGVESDARDGCRRGYPADVEFRSTTRRSYPDVSPVAALATGNAGDCCGCRVGVRQPGHGGTMAALCHVGSDRRVLWGLWLFRGSDRAHRLFHPASGIGVAGAARRPRRLILSFSAAPPSLATSAGAKFQNGLSMCCSYWRRRSPG